MTEFVVVGDVAWLPKDWERRQKRQAYERSPERMARKREVTRRWEAAHAEERRAYKAAWARQRRKDPEFRARENEANRAYFWAHHDERLEAERRRRVRIVGSLHDLACTGRTRRTGCVCRKVPVYGRAVVDNVDNFGG